MTDNFNSNDFVEFGDTRNPKSILNEKYDKHNKGKKELIRINYIKQQRESQSFNDKFKPIKKRGPLSYKQPNKRVLQKISMTDSNFENNTQPIFNKIKKNKKPKKDRVRF